MRIRGTGLAVLVLCVLGGLIAVLFTPAIAATLAAPATSSGVGSVVTGTHSQPTAPVTTKAVPMPTVQPTTLANGVTMLAQDTFQRPDQAFWGTSSGLRVWGGDANTNPAFAIVNHAGQITGGQGALQATLDVASADADILVRGTVSQFDENGDINLGVVLRWQDTNNWYKALINGNILQVLKDANGQISVLGTHAFNATNGTGYSLRFRVMGSNLFAKAWPSAQTEPTNWTIMKIDTALTTGMSGIRVKVVDGVVIRILSFKETSVPTTM
jgi:hypothetical protein